MRERDVDARKFQRQHYEIIAKQFRVALEPYMEESSVEVVKLTDSEYQRLVTARTLGARQALIDLMLNMALRFQADSEIFDPDIFLTRCSPDPDRYPLAELWIGFVEKHQHSMKVED